MLLTCAFNMYLQPTGLKSRNTTNKQLLHLAEIFNGTGG